MSHFAFPKPKTEFERQNEAMFRIWHWMIQRCSNPMHKSYKNYGQRGVTVHEAWLGKEDGFKAFFEHIGPRPTPTHTIDRIDCNGHYEPGNVKWATREEQEANKRQSQKETS